MTYLLIAKYTLYFPTANIITCSFTYQESLPIYLLNCSKEFQPHLKSRPSPNMLLLWILLASVDILYQKDHAHFLF